MLQSNVIELFEPSSKPKNEIADLVRGPIETEMRLKLATLKGTKYPDTFDWGVYDRISSKFEEQPRGTVVFKTTLKLVNYHSSCSKCHYAFEIDAYGRGCFHNCVYCYAKDQLTAHGFWNRPQPFPVDLAEVRKIFYTVFETDKKSKWRDVLTKKVPLRIGSMSDSFMWMDTKYGVTVELLKILNFYRYPYIIFTRSDLVARDNYTSLLQNGLCSVQFSISGNNKKLTRIMEPGAPSYEKRLVALKKLADAGIWTTVRINPLFPLYPDGYYSDREQVVQRFGSEDKIPRLPMYDADFIPQLAEAKVPSILAGFVRLSPQAINNMSKITGLDLASFYTPEMYKERGDKKYSDAEIRKYYEMFKSACDRNDLRFNTCYIGNGEKDFYQYQGMWSNKSDCCDAKGNVEGFVSTSQAIPWETRIAHATSKTDAAEVAKREKEMFESYKNVIPLAPIAGGPTFH